jgi:coproporphyrinogen III oxidase
VWWSEDLTPYYLIERCITFSSELVKLLVSKHNPDFYLKYKKQCDGYFGTHIAMKQRGINFVLRLCKATEEVSMENWFDFVSEVGNSF